LLILHHKKRVGHLSTLAHILINFYFMGIKGVKFSCNAALESDFNLQSVVLVLKNCKSQPAGLQACSFAVLQAMPWFRQFITDISP
jgi:hypothetical protein